MIMIKRLYTNAKKKEFVATTKYIFIGLCIFVCWTLYGIGQPTEKALLEINNQRLTMTRNAMWVLGGWAVGNVLTGAIYRGSTSGRTKYFHEMNLYWGVINLGLSGFVIYQSYQADPGAYDLLATINEQEKLEKLVLFNNGLNVAYIMTGLFLIERGKRPEHFSERLIGFGNSLILQGGFLLLFDTIQYFAYHHALHPKISELIAHIHLSPHSIGLTFAF